MRHQTFNTPLPATAPITPARLREEAVIEVVTFDKDGTASVRLMPVKDCLDRLD